MRTEKYWPRYFDNFDDNTIQLWENIKYLFVQVNNPRLYKLSQNTTIDVFVIGDKIKRFCEKEQVKLGAFLEEYIKKNSRKIDNQDKIDLVSILANMKYYNDSGKSATLFRDFSPYLIKLVKKLIPEQIELVKKQQWKNQTNKKNRIKLLNEELQFFSQ